MKTKQEQIEEMAKVIQKIYITKISRNEYCLAQDIYKAGYRKASELIDEFVKRFRDLLIDKVPKNYKENYEHYNYPIDTIEMFILKVATEMRQEVEKCGK